MKDRILFLCHPESDYGELFLYTGLCELLGEDNVVVYPAKLDYLGIVNKYYILDGGKRGNTGVSDYIKVRNTQIWTMEEICEQINSFKFIVLSSPRTYAIRALRFLKKYLTNLPPIVYTDHEDSQDIHYEIIKEFNPVAVFKRELTSPVDNVYPLPFSSTIPYIKKKFDDQEKKLNIFASFGYTWGFRYKAIEFLVNTYGQKDNFLAIDCPQDNKAGLFPSKISYFDYLEKLAQSKIAISIRGHGMDTVRFFEVPSFETLFLVKDPGIIIPNPFEDKKHCVYFNDLDDMKEKIDYYLIHDDERIVIAKAGKEHLMKYHTNVERARYFLNIIGM